MENWTQVREQLAAAAPDHAEALAKYEDPKAFIQAALRPDPPDWRKQIAGDNADDLKALERFPDEGALYKAFRDTQTALRESGRIKIPGENATPEEVAAYRKAMGVPDGPDGYKVSVKPPEGYEPTDADKTFLDTATKKLHEAGAPPQFVDLMHELYFGGVANSLSELEARYDDSALKADKALTDLWGSRKTENVAYANAAVAQYFGPGENGANPALVDLKIEAPDGFVGNLGDWPPFVAMMAQVGRQHAEDPYFLKAMGQQDVPDPVQRKEQIMALRSTNPKEYARLAAEGGELDKLNAAIERQAQRKGNRAA
ncbi:MAG: hypothetical protein EBR82_08040 [Caulobacteraceae bacterium]|nr:hypothetical protein [Caulobacteraceae bacterium]